MKEDVKVLLMLLTLTLEIECASRWYSGENRPYQFGYTIEGNQHRRESKDIHGRIMGEYGFITADNVYHVTVYATDENGNFKIISMKNIKLQSLPEIDQSKTITTTTIQPFTVKTTDASQVMKNGEPCASCRLLPKPEIETVKPSIMPSEEDTSTIPPPFKIVSKENTPGSNIMNQQNNINNKNVDNSLSSEIDKSNKQLNKNDEQQNIKFRQPSMNEKLNALELSKNKLQGGLYQQQHQQQQQQQVTRNNQQQNSNGLLYRFDYATDYQGHKEEGDQLGNKNGEYFSVGRDNIKRIVSYNANEFGFMPHIRQQSLTQNELRQYDEQNNKLRHYNFEWFYPNSHLFG